MNFVLDQAFNSYITPQYMHWTRKSWEKPTNIFVL